jgi:hypothetical protein
MSTSTSNNHPHEEKQQAISVVPSSTPAVLPESIIDDTRGEDGALNFIGPGSAVKELFTLPYSTNRVSVAVHNMGGTLLMEEVSDVDKTTEEEQQRPRSRRRKRPEWLGAHSEAGEATLMDADGSEDALAIVSSILQLPAPSETKEEDDGPQIPDSDHRPLVATPPHGPLLALPPPEGYTAMPPLPEPRQYLPWSFYGNNLLVGSDVVIYRSHLREEETVLRVAEMSQMEMLVRANEERIRQETGRSYAQALTEESPKQAVVTPDLNNVQLQTVVPVEHETGPLDPAVSGASALSPVCTVIDAYLDNIIANVPQLALCLREKGFIQSVKLFRTEDIPSSFIHASTLDGVSTTTVSSSDDSPLFSPQLMEMNASTLLNFLKANCSRDDSTYLLRREAGESNIRLYDITTASKQRQRKWIWWLAIMSYRFAVRLGQLSSHQEDRGRKRTFRARQRSLLENAQELLSELADMTDEGAHETLAAAVCEHLADTFLAAEVTDDGESSGVMQIEASPFLSVISSSFEHPFSKVTMDSLTKAQDHLMEGIRILMPLFERTKPRPHHRRRLSDETRRTSRSSEEVKKGNHSDGETGNENDTVAPGMSLDVALQIFGMNRKLIDVSLRLSEHHLKNYFSSSAMQALRTAARRLSDAIALLEPFQHTSLLLESDTQRLRLGLCYQYTSLWEHCALFARSFAADHLWRERGHCGGDDVISVLREVEAALAQGHGKDTLSSVAAFIGVGEIGLVQNSKGRVGLHSLSGLTAVPPDSAKKDKPATLTAAKNLLESRTLIQRDQRHVLVASCIAYGRAIASAQELCEVMEASAVADKAPAPSETTLRLPVLLQPLLGDACNELGQLLLKEVRSLLSSPRDTATVGASSLPGVAKIMLDSAQFWFLEGLNPFKQCSDIRNIALLYCNLCQCCKLRSNSTFLPEAGAGSNGDRSAPAHAEICLQDAADHLQRAHEAMGERQIDPVTWDMVSNELAATFLVLGVRRRQSLLGGGSTPVILEAMRLSPGKERSIVDPIERSLAIYEQLGNVHQAAAANYQLALFYSKVWTCQRDETKTREKLTKAFQHFEGAHAYFRRALRGNEATFVVLCLDLANLYSTVSGTTEGLWKAMMCCLDTTSAFSPEACEQASQPKGGAEWLSKMCTLASELEDRLFKILVSLVKLEKDSTSSKDGKDQHKQLYRDALAAKVTTNSERKGSIEYLIAFHTMLQLICDKVKSLKS